MKISLIAKLRNNDAGLVIKSRPSTMYVFIKVQVLEKWAQENRLRLTNLY